MRSGRSISVQLFGLIGLSAVSLLILSVFAAVTLKDAMLDAAIAKTRNLAEVARATAGTFRELARKGEFDEARAQSLAKDIIRGMRFGEDEYFFVYDQLGTELVHGTLPEREGKNFIHAPDAKGYVYIPDMLRMARSGGEGHVFYWFPKPDSDVPLRKVSSVIGFEPWGWMISDGVYLDDVDAHFWNALRKFSLIGGSAIVLVSIIAFLISRSISGPVRALTAVTARIGAGRYDVEVPATGRRDEIGVLAGAIRVLRDEARAAERLRTEQERLNRVLRTVGAGNAVLFHAAREDELVERMCREIVETGGFRMAWIGLAENDEARTVRPVAVAGHEDGYLSLASISWADEPRGGGPTGIAIRTGVPQVNHDTAAEPAMSPWREAALQRGYASSISLPMKGARGVLGCLTIYASEPLAFSAVDAVALLVDLANNLAFGIRAARERRRREEMERQLNQAQKMEALGQLAGSVAHDFHNLLGAILGFAGFIVEDTAEDNPSRHHAERIVAAGERGKTLIGQILSFARRGDLKRECFPLGELVEETQDLLAAAIPAATRITVVGSPGPTLVLGDRDQLQQVLLNLCVNAHDALGGRPGRVTIATRPTDGTGEAFARLARNEAEGTVAAADVWADEDGTAHAVAGSFDPTWPHVSLVVSDSGCGMDERLLAQVFTPFFTTKTTGYGTGLGLAMVHRAVLAHGGAVVVDSRPGRGTRFEVTLPLADEADRPQGLRSAAAVPGMARAEGRLLLVDDDPDFGDMLQEALERRGFEVSPFADPRDAAAALGRRPGGWDAVVADQVMPHMTGADFIRAVRSAHPTLPCLLCTGYAEDNLDEESLRDAGIFALVRKPVDIDQLVNLLVRAMAKES